LKPFSAALPGPRVGKSLAEERAWLIADARQESTHLGVFYERCARFYPLSSSLVRKLLIATAEYFHKRYLAACFPIGTHLLKDYCDTAAKVCLQNQIAPLNITIISGLIIY